MTATVGLARPIFRPPLGLPVWVGDPAILVFATRYALTLHAGHVPAFVQQAILANASTLTMAAGRLLIRDVRTWLDSEKSADAEPADRAAWVAVLAALGAEA